MIEKFVRRFDAARPALLAGFLEKDPGGYEGIVHAVIEAIDADDYDSPDPKRIHKIDDGDYQGTLLWVIGCTGYQPSKYWAVSISYGSCGGCDTYQAIRDNGNWDDKPSEDMAKQYMTLALHVVQNLKEICS